MARKLRLEYPGAIYHPPSPRLRWTSVMNRGDRREVIFRSDADRRLFLETLGQACLKTGWQVHALCLMANHFHLVVETPYGNLVAGMKWFLGTYTSRFNRRHKLFGHLFSGRYKSLNVEGSGTGYLKTVCDYVHLNPVRAKLLRPEQKLLRAGWTVRELAQWRKGDAVKVRLARRLRQETTMTLSWIAKQLHMGTAGSLANLLRKTK